MKIYTRTGDSGETGLFAGGRISKGHARLHAYGTIDELNTILGLVIAAGVDDDVRVVVERVQAELFSVGSDLATPLDAKSNWVIRTSEELILRLEQEIDTWQEELPPLKLFILPGGCMAGAFLHQARTVCRRAERWLVTLQEAEPINADTLRYINRLSDWLFVVARLANLRVGQPETVWEGPDRAT